MLYEKKWLYVTREGGENSISRDELAKRIDYILKNYDLNFKRSMYDPAEEIDMKHIPSDFVFDEKDKVYYISNKDGYVAVKDNVVPWNSSEKNVTAYTSMKYEYTFNTPVDSTYEYYLAIFPYDTREFNRFAITTAIQEGDWIKFTPFGFSILFRFGVDNNIEEYETPRYYVITDYYPNEPIISKDTHEYVSSVVESQRVYMNNIREHFKSILNTKPISEGISLRGDINCRVGPGIVYDVLGLVHGGQSIKICDEIEDIAGHVWYYAITPNIRGHVFICKDYVIEIEATSYEEDE